jgi:hypothetical protein
MILLQLYCILFPGAERAIRPCHRPHVRKLDGFLHPPHDGQLAARLGLASGLLVEAQRFQEQDGDQCESSLNFIRFRINCREHQKLVFEKKRLAQGCQMACFQTKNSNLG